MKMVCLMILCCTFSGCLNWKTFSSGVLPMGPDTFSISAQNLANPTAAKKAAIDEATNYCRAQGKEILVTNLSVRQIEGQAGAGYDVTFRCLSKDDPEFIRPIFRAEPNVKIEDIRK